MSLGKVPWVTGGAMGEACRYPGNPERGNHPAPSYYQSYTYQPTYLPRSHDEDKKE